MNLATREDMEGVNYTASGRYCDKAGCCETACPVNQYATPLCADHLREQLRKDLEFWKSRNEVEYADGCYDDIERLDEYEKENAR